MGWLRSLEVPTKLYSWFWITSFLHILCTGHSMCLCLRYMLSEEKLRGYLIYLQMVVIHACSNPLSKALKRYISFYSCNIISYLLFPSWMCAWDIDNMSMFLFPACKQAMVYDAQQAESLISLGMAKRATATTNSNNQSRCVATWLIFWFYSLCYLY